MGCSETQYALVDLGKMLFNDLRRIAETLDSQGDNQLYQQVCDRLIASFDDPDLTCSARFLQMLKENGIEATGLALAGQYRAQLCAEPLEVLTGQRFSDEAQRSRFSQQETEESDTLSFEAFYKAKASAKEKGHVTVA